MALTFRLAPVLPALLAGGVLAGCASDPGNPTALLQAREAYMAAATDPAVAERAPLELRRAETALRAAEAAQSSGDGADEVAHRSYVAARQAEVARETAAMRSARATVAGAETARLEARNTALEQQLRALQAEQTERGLVMTLGDVLFATGRAELTPGALTRIDRLAEFLHRYPGRTVRIEGHTDSTGSSAVNLRLSEDRAAAVQQALIDRGVGRERIAIAGYGAARPVATNATDAGRQSNRRVEIVLPDQGTVAEVR
ncbi:OmpA family protein [Azospirillum halopraeferens]|uniref:OmpA family protein n=1 Tax=Azospirillum halopraeferens TaxID=34010 RepID=UPI0003FDB125|nr:OmpA family protein [Azospirillum halopraeferens]